MNEYYSGEHLVHYHKKNGKGELPLFCGNVERVIPVYAADHRTQGTQSLTPPQLLGSINNS